MKQLRTTLFWAISVLMGFPGALLSQATTGNLSGVITDPSGAVVIGAEVKITNMGTRVEKTYVSNSAGFYEFPFLPLGSYEVDVKMPGFASFRQTGVEITGARTQLFVTLKLGEVTEVVEVLDTTPILQTREASTGTVLEERKIDELPVFARSAFQLLNIVPGASVNDVAGDGQQNRVNGSRMGMSKYLMDGVSISRENFQGSGVIFSPQLESLAEVTVIANNFSAEYGRVQGAVVAMNLKSGTNRFHGDLIEFWRNSALNAKNFFAPGKKPLFNSHLFGGTLGGPILKNKLFFFGAYQGQRSVTPRQGILNTVPTEAMRHGDFSEIGRPIFDPATTDSSSPYGRLAFPGNIIPSNRINSSGVKALQLYPLPNRPGVGANYLVSPPSRTQADQVQAKIDYQLSEKDRIYGRLTIDPVDVAAEPIYQNVGNTNTATNYIKNYGTQINHSHTFTANFVNEFRFGYQDTNNVVAASDEQASYQGGVIGIPPNDPAAIGFPYLSLAGCAEDCALGVASPFRNDKQRNYSFDDVASVIRGKQSLKFGGNVRQLKTFETRQNCPAGCYSFNGSFTNNPANAAATGYALADMLLGMPISVTQTFSSPVDFHSREFGLFLQNDIKVNRKLSLNLGVRWDYFGTLKEAEGRIAAFDPTQNLIVQKTKLSTPAKNLFVPRVGLAYLLREKTVLRAAYGISTFPQLQAIGLYVQGVPPLSRSQIVARRGTFFENLTQPAVTLGQALPAIPQGQFPVTPSPSLAAPYFPDYIATPYWQMWNLTVQHQVLDNLSVEVAYVGTKGVHMDSFVNVDFNLPAASQYGPDELFGGKTFQQRRPYPSMGPLTYFGTRGDSEYNGLQATANWKYKEGLSFVATYSKQKGMTNHTGHCCNTEFRTGVGGTTYQKDSSNWRLQWAPDGSTPYDVFILNYNYELPFGSGKRYMNRGGLANAVAGGWQVSGVYTARSGNQFGVSSSSAEQRFPNRICDGNLPTSQRTLERWFDTSCFVNPSPIYALGNAGFAIVEGPGTSNTDFTLFKNFRALEKVKIQFRADFFNLTNTPQFFLGRAVTVGTPNFGRITNSGNAERGLTSQSNRSIQLALKLSF